MMSLTPLLKRYYDVTNPFIMLYYDVINISNMTLLTSLL